MKALAIPMIDGMLATGYLVAALYFLKFWARTRDRLFALFATSFMILAIQRTATVMTAEWSEHRLWVYVLRLIAFLLILAAIVDKNLTSSASKA